ncbi:hypothetical protein BC629DRAFT_1622205 [Irpex lacteus]|nr:hypothetical protein BC629DRAFT_1622205 [Irpex lacteus]
MLCCSYNRNLGLTSVAILRIMMRGTVGSVSGSQAKVDKQVCSIGQSTAVTDNSAIVRNGSPMQSSALEHGAAETLWKWSSTSSSMFSGQYQACQWYLSGLASWNYEDIVKTRACKERKRSRWPRNRLTLTRLYHSKRGIYSLELCPRHKHEDFELLRMFVGGDLGSVKPTHGCCRASGLIQLSLAQRFTGVGAEADNPSSAVTRSNTNVPQLHAMSPASNLSDSETPPTRSYPYDTTSNVLFFISKKG